VKPALPQEEKEQAQESDWQKESASEQGIQSNALLKKEGLEKEKIRVNPTSLSEKALAAEMYVPD
jgi:hypothetical protein